MVSELTFPSIDVLVRWDLAHALVVLLVAILLAGFLVGMRRRRSGRSAHTESSS